MKNKDIFLILGAVLIVVLMIFVTSSNSDDKIESPIALSGEEIGLINVGYDIYESKIENGENFIIVIERTGCSYCEKYMPVLEDATSELSIPVYYIDTADLTSSEYSALGESNNYLRRNKWGTPTTLLMSGRNVVASISGYVDKETFLGFVDENVIISQEENTDVE